MSLLGMVLLTVSLLSPYLELLILGVVVIVLLYYYWKYYPD